MIEAEVIPGACGMKAIIRVQRDGRDNVLVDVVSDCPGVAGFGKDLGCLNWKKDVFKKIDKSPVYGAAARNLKHPDCPLPSALIKAIMVEIGAAVPAEVSIKFKQKG